VEASLLPSRAIRLLGKQVVLVAVRGSDPRCAGLRKEFSVPYLNSWVVVLNEKGETLDSWIGDRAGEGCNKRSLGKFPANLVKLFKESLQFTNSAEELERKWRSDPTDMGAFEAFASRLRRISAFERLHRLYRAAAANRSLAAKARAEIKIRAFLDRAEDPATRPYSQRGQRQFLRKGEALLIALAKHPSSADLPAALFSYGCAHTFDVPGRSAAAVVRLKRRAQAVGNPPSLKERIRQFSRIRRQWINMHEEFLKTANEGCAKNSVAALLGDPEAAIQLAEDPHFGRNSRYQQWAQDARKKLRSMSHRSR
jgi:hypothetical protein